MTLTTQIRASVTAQLSKSGDLGSPAATLILSFLDTLEDGVTNLTADLVWAETSTIAASDTGVLDFGTGGGLVDALGDPFEPAEICLYYAKADEDNVNNVVFGANASEPWLGPMAGTTPTTAIKPGAFFLWFAPQGWAVTNNSADKMKRANSGAGSGVDFSEIIIGRSA